MATSLPLRDGLVAFPGNVSRVYPIQMTASPEHAPHRSHLAVKLIPASAPRVEEMSHSRGSVLDF